MLSVFLVRWRFMRRVKQCDVANLRQPMPEKPKEKKEKRESMLAACFKRSSPPTNSPPIEEEPKESAVDNVDTTADLEAAAPLVKVDPFEATTTLMDGLTRLVLPCSLVVLACLVAGLSYLPTDTFIGIYPNEAV
ncbi:hypothetical protein M427DRAFT_155473 [Gonapodya prolifera JEL478]|uniref:Uncharacterized protein n=1 Tax=Gonapodya prolifera (strain JEL478) TaxID=1344416 RepID=A0A139AEQ5_GONPJ|nr:hypothetical protein M427DRAFT_155473 [Gonapodya prolifera JEL478]|eukprot:KXS15302.1 hypothetical protein M427DRAFT_155473 [Gonapodya prolifera JEL478]